MIGVFFLGGLGQGNTSESFGQDMEQHAPEEPRTWEGLWITS
jgi:hypothetical protein